MQSLAGRRKCTYPNSNTPLASISSVQVIYALVNDTLFAVVDAFKKDVAGKIPKLGNCFTSGKRSTSGIEMLKNLNNKVSKNDVSLSSFFFSRKL